VREEQAAKLREEREKELTRLTRFPPRASEGGSYQDVQNRFMRKQAQHLKNREKFQLEGQKERIEDEDKYVKSHTVHRRTSMTAEEADHCIARLHKLYPERKERKLQRMRKEADEEELEELQANSVHKKAADNKTSPSPATRAKIVTRLYDLDVARRQRQAGERWQSKIQEEKEELLRMDAESIHAVAARVGLSEDDFADLVSRLHSGKGPEGAISPRVALRLGMMPEGGPLSGRTSVPHPASSSKGSKAPAETSSISSFRGSLGSVSTITLARHLAAAADADVIEPNFDVRRRQGGKAQAYRDDDDDGDGDGDDGGDYDDDEIGISRSVRWDEVPKNRDQGGGRGSGGRGRGEPGRGRGFGGVVVGESESVASSSTSELSLQQLQQLQELRHLQRQGGYRGRRPEHINNLVEEHEALLERQIDTLGGIIQEKRRSIEMEIPIERSTEARQARDFSLEMPRQREAPRPHARPEAPSSNSRSNGNDRSWSSRRNSNNNNNNNSNNNNNNLSVNSQSSNRAISPKPSWKGGGVAPAQQGRRSSTGSSPRGGACAVSPPSPRRRDSTPLLLVPTGKKEQAEKERHAPPQTLADKVQQRQAEVANRPRPTHAVLDLAQSPAASPRSQHRTVSSPRSRDPSRWVNPRTE